MDNEEAQPEELGQDTQLPDKLKHRVMKPGESFGNFRVVKCLCAGLIANYYHMQHIRDLHDVTVAIFHHRTAKDQKFVKRLQNLQKTTNGFDHEGIPKIRDCTEINDNICLFLDPVKGQTLSQYFEAHATPGSQGLGQETTTRILAQLLGILGYAHSQGVDHRDIDSDMIFVQEDGSIRILGLGIKAALGTDLFEAIVSASVSPLASNKTMGRLNSFDVMSPEYKAGITEDARVDLYIAGVIGYWLLTAHKPQLATLQLPSALVDDLPLKWDTFFTRMLEREQDKRLQSSKLALLALKDADEELDSEHGGYVQRQIDRIPVPKSIKDRGELATRIYRLLFLGFFGITTVSLAAYFFTTLLSDEEELIKDIAEVVEEGEEPNLVIEVTPPVAKIAFPGYDEIHIVKDGLLRLKVVPGTYSVRASAPQRTVVTEKVSVRSGGQDGPLRINFNLVPAWSDIQIRTEPDAVISVIDARDIEIELGAADDEGIFMLKEGLFSGSYRVIVRKEGYEQKTLANEELQFGEAAVLDAKLTALPATLTVRTDPSGALITVNDKKIGPSPAMTDSLEPNQDYLIVAQMEGYRAIGKRIKVGAGEDLIIDMGELVPKSAELSIQAEFEGLSAAESKLLLQETTVALNELRYPVGSKELKFVPEGKYTVSLEHPQYKSDSVEVSLSDRDVKSLNFTLIPRPAQVELVLPENLDPTIRLNRQEVRLEGRTIAIPAYKAVEFELSIPEYLTMVRTFDLQPNETVVWNVQPVPIPGPEVGKNWTMPYINYAFSWIPPGTYTMGSPLKEEGRLPNEGDPTTVRLTKGFWAGSYEVTQGAYREIMNKMPSEFIGAKRPVDSVTWEEANAFCLLLTSAERKAGRLPEGYVYRLPTEAEWEYAARAGTTGPFHFGDEADTTKGNFRGVYPRALSEGVRSTESYGTEAVGSYEPNAFGLYDMHGNVSEWTLDAYNGRLPGGSVTDPKPRTGGSRYTLRGGSWEDFAVRVRSAARVDARASTESNAVGFRVFLAPEK